MSVNDEIERVVKRPECINFSKSHNNQDLFAISKNTLRQTWTVSAGGTTGKGNFSFNNIHPSSFHTGINNLYIMFSCDIVFTSDVGVDADKTAYYNAIMNNLDKLYFNDINCALYNTNVSIGTQSNTNQPYISYAIKRLYNSDFYHHNMIINKRDRNVSIIPGALVAPDGNNQVNGSYTVSYTCCSPLCHPYLNTKSDIAGITSMIISSSYNLDGLITGISSIPCVTGAQTRALVDYTNISFNLCMNDVIYSQPQIEYSSLILTEMFFNDKRISTNNAIINDSFNCNVRDTPSTPINQYVICLPDLDTKNYNFDIAIGGPIDRFLLNNYRLNSLTIDVNGSLNSYNTSSFNNIYHCCKNAGFKGEMRDLNEASPYPKVFGFSSLQYKNVINSSDTYRFSISNALVTSAGNVTENYSTFIVYEYPTLLYSSPEGMTTSISVGMKKEITEVESDIDQYVKELEMAGYSGSGLMDTLRKFRDKIKQGRYISKIGDFLGNLTGNQLFRNALSIIPAIGDNRDKFDKIMDRTGDISKKIGDVSGKFGYGVRMF